MDTIKLKGRWKLVGDFNTGRWVATCQPVSHTLDTAIIGTDSDYQCFQCGCSGNLTRHHCIPSVGDAKKRGPIVWACVGCHILIHQTFTNHDLATKYNTPDLLLAALADRRNCEVTLRRTKPSNVRHWEQKRFEWAIERRLDWRRPMQAYSIAV